MDNNVNLMADTLSKCSHTPGPWKTDACGGFSTVVSMTQPMRADTRIGAYGYDPRRGHCIGYPFIEDDGKVKRIDFVCFSHEDARLIAAAPELLQGMKDLYRAYVNLLEAGRDRIATYGGQCDSVEVMERGDPWLNQARDVVAKAEGQSCA